MLRGLVYISPKDRKIVLWTTGDSVGPCRKLLKILLNFSSFLTRPINVLCFCFLVNGFTELWEIVLVTFNTKPLLFCYFIISFTYEIT